jgi:hypothetical protein
MSTFEAIAQALGILEGPETEGDMLKFFAHVLDHMVHHSRKDAHQRAALGKRIVKRTIP